MMDAPPAAGGGLHFILIFQGLGPMQMVSRVLIVGLAVSGIALPRHGWAQG